MTNLKDPGLGKVALAAILISGASAASATTISIQRSTGGAVSQDFTARSVSYRSADQTLIVESASGSRVCGAAAGSSAGKGGTLLLDGVSYAIDGHDFRSGARSVTVSPRLSGGSFPMCISQAISGGAATVAKGENDGELEARIDVEVNGNASGRKITSVNGQVSFNPFVDGGQIRVPIADNVVCMNSDDAADQGLLLVDKYGVETSHRGLVDIDYYPSAGGQFPSRTVVLKTGPKLVCLSSPTGAVEVTELSAAKGAGACELIDDRLFAGGFGDPAGSVPQVSPPGVELKVGLELEAFATVPSGTNEAMSYTLNVRNCGAEAAQNVAIRDVWPRKDANAPRFRSVSSWECVENCTGNGTGYITGNFGSLASGAQMRIRGTRDLKDSPGTNGQFVRLGMAAWPIGGRSEYSPADNIASYSVEIKTTNNAPPSVAITGSPAAINEDSALALLAESAGQTAFTISAVDPDDAGISAVSVSAATPNQVAQLFVDDSNPANVLVQVRPFTDFFGTLTLNVVATDAGGAQSAVETVDMVVRPVNDAPKFSVFGDFVPPSGSGDPSVGPQQCGPESDAGCADQVWPEDVGARNVIVKTFVAATFSGASNEDDDMTLQVEVVSGSEVFNGATFEPRILSSGALNYALSGTSGTAQIRVRAVDDGGTARGGDSTSDYLFFDITVQ